MARQSGLNLFQTSRQAGSIPLVLVLGDEGVGKTHFLNLLLEHHSMEGSVVVGPIQTDGEMLEGARYIPLPRVTTSAQDGCLCCGMHSGLGDALRKLFFEALTERRHPLNRVFIESRGVETDQLAFTLRHTPFLGQRYFHQLTFRLISANHLLLRGSGSLSGLEPENGREKQILIVSQFDDARSMGSSDRKSRLNAIFKEILHNWPYQQVLYLEPKSIATGLGLS